MQHVDVGAQSSTCQGLSELVLLPSHDVRLRRMKHHVRTAGRLVGETMARHGRGLRALFVTLTYRRADAWEPRHISDFLERLRKWAKRKGMPFGYLWVAEMQKRGAVHYHACIWLPARCGIPRPDKRGWWPHGSSNVQGVKRNAVGYLMKYVSKGAKGSEPDYPRGARICGSGGLDDLAGSEFHYWRLPRYVREQITIGERCSRVPGGGWMHKETGQVWRSEYGLFGIGLQQRGEDCRGAPRRPGAVTMLHKEHKRESGGRACLPVTDAIREAWAARLTPRLRALIGGALGHEAVGRSVYVKCGQVGALQLVREVQPMRGDLAPGISF